MIKADEIIRSDRRTLSVSVDALGRVTVRAPWRCSDERIMAFLQDKADWIQRAVAKTNGAGTRLPTENLDGYVFPLLGEQTQIVLTGEKRIRFDDREKRLYLPSDKPQERLVKWLKENAKRILGKHTAEKAAQMGVRYQSVSITSARTRWGSCSGKNAVHYPFRLLYLSREIIEYVVVHELAHTVHKNHSKAFWLLVERYVPDWRARRAQLKNAGWLTYLF